MLKAVIFDMDGVLIDSEPIHVNAELKTFAAYGVNMTVESLQANMGKGMRTFFAEQIECFGLPVDVETLVSDHKTTLARLYREEVTAIPGIQELMAACMDDALPMAVASSTDRDLIVMVLEKLKMLPFFDVIVSGEEVAHYKPSPEIFLETVRRLGVRPQECVIIEDSSAGVKAAEAARIPCVGFRSPNSGCQDLTGADLIIDSITDLDLDRLKSVVSVDSTDR